MSCNGCRVLRKGCGEACVLRTCLQWIDSPDAQGNATLFLAKFFGRSDLLSFIAAVPHHQRPALFQSLLFEACGRTVNPVNGAVGLLSSGNWHVCQAAVETVLHGGALRPMQGILLASSATAMDRSANRLPAAIDRSVNAIGLSLASPSSGSSRGRSGVLSRSPISSDESVGFGIGERKERKLLNLFV